jgi:aryl-alcohol dehydrogenase-like predicted oxidoreductase
VDRVKQVAEKHSCSPGEVAIAWVLHHPEVTGAIVGGRNAEQVQGTIGGAKLKLIAEDMALLEEK